MYGLNINLEFAKQLLEHVGMTYEVLRTRDGYFEVKVGSKHPVDQRFYGRVSIGSGGTELDAVINAASSIGVDWNSVADKVTEKEWLKIARL